jgi:hypothetical protein
MKFAFLGSAAILAGATMLAAPALAGPTIIDFEDNPTDVYFESPITSHGFVATATPDLGGSFPLGTNYAVDGVGPSNGTIHLDSWTNSGNHSIWTLTDVNGAAFSLSQFDFATGDPALGGPASGLTLTGNLVGGGTVTQAITLISGDFNTYLVDSTFQNLLSVTFDATGPDNRSAYDNIHVNQAAGAVPEPASWAMMVGGFGLAGATMRRRKMAIRFA